jgi:hypothetical protein
MAADFKEGGMDEEDSVLIGADSPWDALVTGSRSWSAIAWLKSGQQASSQVGNPLLGIQMNTRSRMWLQELFTKRQISEFSNRLKQRSSINQG